MDARSNRMYYRRNPRRSCPRRDGIPAEMEAMTPQSSFQPGPGRVSQELERRRNERVGGRTRIFSGRTEE